MDQATGARHPWAPLATESRPPTAIRSRYDVPERIDIWHRAAVLEPKQAWSDDLLDSAGVRLVMVGETAPEHVAPRTAIGDVSALICFVAGATAALGEHLRAGLGHLPRWMRGTPSRRREVGGTR